MTGMVEDELVSGGSGNVVGGKRKKMFFFFFQGCLPKGAQIYSVTSKSQISSLGRGVNLRRIERR